MLTLSLISFIITVHFLCVYYCTCVCTAAVQLGVTALGNLLRGLLSLSIVLLYKATCRLKVLSHLLLTDIFLRVISCQIAYQQE